MSASIPVITLKKGKERSLLNRHPWVFSGAIDKEPSGLEEGDTVIVHSSEGKFLATGHFHKGTITVRCVDFIDRPLNQLVWKEKIASAWQYRKTLGLIDSESTNAFRLIHAEGDGFPGLVVDVYGNTAIIQTYTAGMHRAKQELTTALTEVSGGRIQSVYDKSAETMSKQSPVSTQDSLLYTSDQFESEPYVIENNLRFAVDWVQGQKTGFFIDQRENRQLLKLYSAGKTVLNTFCYTGGFSIAALAGNAREVHSVDSSKRAMEGTEKNVNLNFPGARHEGFTEDVMTFFKKTQQTYDIIVLDPPAYAKHLSQVPNAMIGYRNLNTEGFRRINPGGILFTFSCSQAVDRELFRKVIFQSALQAGRKVRIMHQLSQPPDHPVNIYHPEAEYLKGLVLQVE
ncbi:class I SAM-dependent rRNA methyltransferase [soil metagenome]